MSFKARFWIEVLLFVTLSVLTYFLLDSVILNLLKIPANILKIIIIILIFVSWLIILEERYFLLNGDWSKISKNLVNFEYWECTIDSYEIINKVANVESKIMIPEVKIAGVLITSKIITETKKKLKPCLFLHGYNSDWRYSIQYLIPLANEGYAVFAYNHRGHKDSTGDKNNIIGISHDFPKILDKIVEQYKEILDLSEGFRWNETFNRKVKWYSIHFWVRIYFRILGLPLRFNDYLNGLISPKYVLRDLVKDRESIKKKLMVLHSADDTVLPIETSFMGESADQMLLPKQQCIKLERGEHIFRRQETILLQFILDWFK